MFVKDKSTEYKVVVGESADAAKAGAFIAFHVYKATSAQMVVVKESEVSWNERDKNIYVGCNNLFVEAGLTMPSEDLRESGYYIKSKGDSVFIATNFNAGYQTGALAFLRATIGYDFGLYSVAGKGEWYLACNKNADKTKYEALTSRFKITKNWAKNLVKTAKSAGCRYITLTTRHHDGFSLYDTCGLSDFDAPHSACGRDLIREFTEACRAENIVPFFYHTLLDWHNTDYKTNFSGYIDYLDKSIEILCKSYGKIGGFWFDGMWDKPNENWQEDRLYGTIRKYQPEAMIINNTGLSAQGKTGHKEIDSVTFERGKPCFVDTTEKPIAGEMCQVLNDHWG